MHHSNGFGAVPMAIRRVLLLTAINLLPGSAHAIPAPQHPSIAREQTDAIQESKRQPNLSPALRRLPAPGGSTRIQLAREFAGHQETLEEAWSCAATVDRRLKSRQWQVASARENLYAASAGRWPTAHVDSSYVGRNTEPSFTFKVPALMLPSNRFPYAQNEGGSFRARFNVPLYTGGSISEGIKAARSRISAASHDVASSQNDLRLNVAEAYVAVLRRQRAVEVAVGTQNSLRSHASDVKLRYEQKQVPRQDVLAADVATLDARQKVIQARNQLDLSRASYNRILARPLASGVRIAELPICNAAHDLDLLTERATATRPAVSQYVAEISALEHRAASLRGTKLPQIALRGDYTFAENRYQTPEGIASIGVGVDWNVYDHGRISHEAAALSHEAESLRWMMAELKSMIALEVRRAWLDIQETARRLEVTPHACRQADENLRVARSRYVLGAAIGTEVLDAETQRVQAYTNHSNAIYDAVLAEIRLHHAVGQ
ncbi:MAG: TolC family protein [Planctomycetaceae bacterium]